MVLHFSQIPPHLQGKIAEKMDYFQLELLEMSSIHGRAAVQYINIMPIVKTKKIWFGKTNGYIHMEHPKSRRTMKPGFSFLNGKANLPRFFISDVKVKFYATPECFNHAIVNGSRHFLDNGVKLYWECDGPGKMEIMTKISELFNVVNIMVDQECLDDHLFLSMPVFRQVREFFSLDATLPNDVFLSFKASSISFGRLASFTHMRHTLRTFVMQYFQNQREISFLRLSITMDEASLVEMFTGLEHFELIWSVVTHESSDYAYISRDQLPDVSESGDVKCYLVIRGEKKLLVFAGSDLFLLRSTTNEHEEVRRFILSSQTGY